MWNRLGETELLFSDIPGTDGDIILSCLSETWMNIRSDPAYRVAGFTELFDQVVRYSFDSSRMFRVVIIRNNHNLHYLCSPYSKDVLIYTIKDGQCISK
jgi:hypothetical protein